MVRIIKVFWNRRTSVISIRDVLVVWSQRQSDNDSNYSDLAHSENRTSKGIHSWF